MAKAQPTERLRMAFIEGIMIIHPGIGTMAKGPREMIIHFKKTSIILKNGELL